MRPEDSLALAAKVISGQMKIFINFEEYRDHARLPEMAPRYSRVSEAKKLLELIDERLKEIRAPGCAPESLPAEDLIPAVREVVQEESTARNYVTKRYRELIDRKYLTGLSQAENEELDALTLTLEEIDKPYYEAIVYRLRDLIEQR